MAADREALEQLSRDELIADARRRGVHHPELMTRVELVDEILRLCDDESPGLQTARGLFGVARDLLARMVERKLNLPQAAALIRGIPTPYFRSRAPAPVATVTLAEIYAAQGHLRRALGMLDEVLAKEPEHEAARSLRERLARQQPPSAPEPPGPPAALATVCEDGEPVYVYWEVRRERVEQLRCRHPDGRPMVRLLCFQPALTGAQRTERDLLAEPACGGTRVDPETPGSVVRAVLGWQSAAGFRPLVANAIVTTGGEPATGWAPPVPPAFAERALDAYRSLL